MRYGMYCCWATISGEKEPRAMSFLLDLLAGAGSAVALRAIFGFVFQKLGTARDMRKHPPVGRLVDIGGRRLHLWCTGEGSPTVVLDSGLPGSSQCRAGRSQVRLWRDAAGCAIGKQVRFGPDVGSRRRGTAFFARTTPRRTRKRALDPTGPPGVRCDTAIRDVCEVARRRQPRQSAA